MAKVKIGARWVGDGEPCYVIAEGGINHNGDLSIAKRLVDIAVQCRADAVKFQKRRLAGVYREKLLADVSKAEQSLQYILPILMEFELSDSDFVELAEYCAKQGITFLCTPCDKHSVDFLDELKVPAFKIASADMTNFELLEHAASKRKPMIVSTGMATESEVRRTIAFLKELETEFILLHCNSTYPPSPEEINLRFMEKLREWSGVPVGYSGHDSGIAISVAAVALGANVIERHITVDRTMRGPDHAASLEPQGLAKQVRDIREVEAAIGRPRRWLTQGEFMNRHVLSKSLVAASDISAGVVIRREMITARGPGLGLSPQRLYDLVGKPAVRQIRRDEPFLEEDLSGEDPVGPKAVCFPHRWGVVARFGDLRRLLALAPQVVEIHLSDRDLDQGMAGFDGQSCTQELVVHVPEYFQDHLLDLCASSVELRRVSSQRVQAAIDLAKQLAVHFTGTPGTGPKVIVHVGGMSRDEGYYDREAAHRRLREALEALDRSGVELLVENLPPHPWYFGGRWYGHVLVDAEEIAEFCETTGYGMCLDTSHAVLTCNMRRSPLDLFVQRVLPYVRYLHVSDGAGWSGEGLQIGEGDIDFSTILPLLLKTGGTIVPEIWQGHRRDGEGFWEAMHRLKAFLPPGQ